VQKEAFLGWEKGKDDCHWGKSDYADKSERPTVEERKSWWKTRAIGIDTKKKGRDEMLSLALMEKVYVTRQEKKKGDGHRL